MKPHEKLGPITRNLCYLFDGWIVGGSVNYFLDENAAQPKDVDIMIPLSNWTKASKLIPEYAKANKFGGFKFEENKMIYDVWADELSNLFLQNNEKFTAYQPKFNQRVGRL